MLHRSGVPVLELQGPLEAPATNRDGTMSHGATPAKDPAFFVEVFRQNWENVRNIKTERIWFLNTFAAISAGALSLLQAVRLGAVLQISLILFMCLFSIIGLLTSLRLKAELEECLAKIQAMVARTNEREFVALGQSEGDLSRYPKFRWLFPVFFSMASAGFVALLVYRLVAGT